MRFACQVIAVLLTISLDAASATESSARYAVATANTAATDAGMRMLAMGGSAADAAVAIQMVLGVVEPQSSGLGGGSIALYHPRASGDPDGNWIPTCAGMAARPEGCSQLMQQTRGKSLVACRLRSTAPRRCWPHCRMGAHLQSEHSVQAANPLLPGGRRISAPSLRGNITQEKI